MDMLPDILSLMPRLPSPWGALDATLGALRGLGPGERVALLLAVWGALPLLGLPLPGRAQPRPRPRHGWGEGTRWRH